MLSYVVTFRNVSTGAMESARVKAPDREDAIKAGVVWMRLHYPSPELQDPWELYAVNRSEP